MYWGVGIAETVVIIAQFAAPSTFPHAILSVLAIGGDGDLNKVQLSATPTLTLGTVLIIGGATIRLQCYHALGRHFTFETGIFKNHRLVTTGPYSIVRHPSYAGAFLAYAGLMLYYTSPGSWIMECVIKGSTVGRTFGALYALLMFLVIMGLTWRIPKEDQGLFNAFGHEWEAYHADVRYALIPGVF